MSSEDKLNRNEIQDRKIFIPQSKACEFCIENNGWLHRKCHQKMAQSNCPSPESCGEELSQDLTMRISRISDSKWEEIKKKFGYIIAIVRREARRKKEKCGCDDIDQIEDEAELDARISQAQGQDVWHDAERVYTLILFKQVLRRFSKIDQAILSLTHEGYKPEAIGQILSISYANVRQRKSRLMKKLRKIFPEENNG